MEVDVAAVRMDVEATAVVLKVEAKARAHARKEHDLSEPMARADADTSRDEESTSIATGNCTAPTRACTPPHAC